MKKLGVDNTQSFDSPAVIGVSPRSSASERMASTSGCVAKDSIRRLQNGLRRTPPIWFRRGLMLKLVIPRLLGQRRGSLHRQVRCFPRHDTAGNFTDAAEPVALEQTRGDGRAVAARTIDQQRTVLRQFVPIFHQMIERDAQASGDAFLVAFARRAHVDRERRLRRG